MPTKQPAEMPTIPLFISGVFVAHHWPRCVRALPVAGNVFINIKNANAGNLESSNQPLALVLNHYTANSLRRTGVHTVLIYGRLCGIERKLKLI